MRTTAVIPAMLGMFLIQPFLWASGFEIAEQSASAAGTGNTGTARSGDPAAAWYNPAALADGQGWRIGLGITLAMPNISAEAIDGSWKSSTEFSLSTPPYLQVSFAHSNWALGLATHISFASNIQWPEDWAGRFEIQSSQPQFFRIAPFFSWRFGPLRVGGGPHVDVGKLEIRRALHFINTEGRVHALLTGAGVGFHLSAFWEISDWIDVGFSYKSRTSLSLSGDADFTVPDSFADRAPDQQASAAWRLPDRLSAGLWIELGRFHILTDLGLTLWSVNDRLVVDFENAATTDSQQINDWSPSFSVRLGAEFSPSEPWMLRAGAFFDQTPVPASTLAPSSPDSSRVGFTVGGSWTLAGTWTIDVFYEFMVLLQRESSSPNAPLATYGGYANMVGLGMRFHVP